jgi:hypothetical protein
MPVEKDNSDSETILHLGPIMLDQPEEYSFKELLMKAIALESGKLYYSNGRLYILDYDTIHGVMDGKFAIVEMIIDSSFCEVGEYRRWALYHSSEDEVEYVDEIEDIRGGTTVLPVLRTGNRFIRKIEEYIEEGKYRSADTPDV